MANLSRRPKGAVAFCACLWFLTLGSAPAQTVLGQWKPIFKGVEHATGTNPPSGGTFSTLQVVNLLRVDLSDSDVQLFASPRNTNYVAESRETAGYTTTNALKTYKLQAVINANSFYTANGGLPSYTLPEGTAFEAGGLLISQGQVVSKQEGADDPAAMLFGTNNTPTFVPTNWPAHDTSGIFTAVSGTYAVLANGVNIGSNYLGAGGNHALEPRTAIGLSKDRRYLYLMVIDGRQPGYSQGAYDWETAGWLLKAGAWDGANMDGGGSSSMVIMDSTGKPVPLNRDSAAAAYNRQRTVGCHFGIYTKPLPGFFSDVSVSSDDTSAVIRWTTAEPATAQVNYGPTTDLGFSSPIVSETTVIHSAVLANLTPGTEYYFALNATAASGSYTSSLYSLVTTNYVTTNVVFSITNEWKFTTDNLDGVSWTGPTYDDSNWTGPGPGLMWTDSRGPNSAIELPLNTEMPLNPATGYPFRTYYLRTHFTFPEEASGAALWFENYVDDGAVFYLNGREVSRLRMAAAPTMIFNNTLASSYGCGGDATCAQSFYLSGPLVVTNLLTGDNVLAVEVHNYSAQSPDITFGLTLYSVVPSAPAPKLNISYDSSELTLNWSGSGFTLQEADAPEGIWSDVPGPVNTGPYTVSVNASTRFFRLRK